MPSRRRRGEPPPPREPTLLKISVKDAEAALQERIEKGNGILAIPIHTEGDLAGARDQYRTWNEHNTTLLERIFSTPELAREYTYWGMAILGGGPTPLRDKIEKFRDDVSEKIRRLLSMVERLPLYSPTPAETAPTEEKPAMPPSDTTVVFVVHGRNEALKEAVARFLSQLGLEPVILHEKPSGGRTVIEKFEEHANARFAVILLTPDDVGGLAGSKPEDLQPRARQNVIFEWGFYVAKLGRRNVCALRAEGVELPSDVHGIVYVELDPSGAWKMLLARELKAAGLCVDLNRAI